MNIQSLYETNPLSCNERGQVASGFASTEILVLFAASASFWVSVAFAVSLVLYIISSTFRTHISLVRFTWPGVRREA